MRDERRIDGLTHVPVRVTGLWVPKTVTTDPPRYVSHTEYALAWTCDCDTPILPVMMLIHGQEGRFAKPWRSSAMHSLRCRLSFFPGDWRASEQVWINLEGLQVVVEDSVLKHDPRTRVQTDLVGEQRTIETGDVITLASVAADAPVKALLLLVAKSDTEAKRGRWVMKQSLAAKLPDELRFLTTGRTAGTF